MDSPQNQNHVPPAEGFGTVPNAAAPFGMVPQNAETFGSVRHGAEDFRPMPPPAEERDKYTLSVREVARMFETAGVARSERSIVNWCQRNALGVGKLDAYFDPNDRKYFITPESVDLAIAEEKAKAVRYGHDVEEVVKAPQQTGESMPSANTDMPADAKKVKELETEVRNLKITNQVKDQFIDLLKQEREGMVEQLTASERRVGELETKLLQIESPKPSHADDAQERI